MGEIDPLRLEESLSALPSSVEERTDWLGSAFRQAGCPTQVMEGARGDNVLCTLQGESEYTVVVAANVDHLPGGRGIVGNWTGMALLPLLYEALQVAPRQHSFVFAGFSDAVLEYRGARRFLREMGRDDRAQIRAMVQLNALGLGTPAMWGERADPNLRQDLFSVSQALQLPLRNVGFQRKAVVDARIFRRKGIPTITIHSLDASSARLLERSSRARETAPIDWPGYHATARLLVTYLAYLDRTLQLRVDRELAQLGGRAAAPPPPL